MRKFLLIAALVVGVHAAASAQVQVGVGIALPGVRIGINVPAYPNLVAVPGYPVYYAPRLDLNYFFYNGFYWVFVDDNWYSSSWYDGPWDLVQPDYVPYFLLRVPIQYYRRPPPYFHPWDRRQPPRWGEHWGGTWQQRHREWNRWDRKSTPKRLPLPAYQRRYQQDNYPGVERQRTLQNRYYPYKPRAAQPRQTMPRDQSQMQRRQPPMQRNPPTIRREQTQQQRTERSRSREQQAGPQRKRERDRSPPR